MISTTRKEYEELIARIDDLDYHYYVLADPKIHDEDYDRLYAELISIERVHPDWITESSPSQRVGGKLNDKFMTVIHQRPMMSLANTYSEAEMNEFIERITRSLPRKKIEYTCEPKLDGVAVSLQYVDGILKFGVTRGDGKRGDDITANIRTVRGVPFEIRQGPGVGKSFEVRGEVVMNREDFRELSLNREEVGQTPFANPRNATAGSLKLLNPKEVRKRKLRVWVYELHGDKEWAGETHAERLETLEKMLFPVVKPWKTAKSIEEIQAFWQDLEDNRSQFPHDMDGVVVKVSRLDFREKLGTTAKTPRWAIAYKFRAQKAVTILKEITHQVGRTGAITPVADLEPVELAGSTIRRSTLHNEEEVQRLQIGPGIKVILEKAGDVIPKILGRAEGQPKGDYTPPVECPECGEKLVKTEGEVIRRCINFACPAQLKGRLQHFVSRGAMDIDGMGIQTIELLVDNGLIKDPGDIYSLTLEQLSVLPGMGDLSARKLVFAILDSKKQPLERLIFALGIRHVGARVSSILERKFGHLDELADAIIKPKLLENIDEIGPKIAESLIEFFSRQRNLHIIEKLRKAEVNFGKRFGEVDEDLTPAPLIGQKIVITGTLAVKRAELQSRLEALGARIVSSVSSKTDFVVAGESPGSKLTKANELGVAILDEKQILSKLAEWEKPGA